MIELSTLGAVIKAAYESQNNTNAFTDAEKIKLAELAVAAFSGAFADLTGVPDFVQVTQKGVANGVATLDASGVVPLSQLNVSGLQFKGAWNAATNTPTLLDGVGSVGDYYKASVPGTYNFGNGSYTFTVGDWVIFAGGTWQRIAVHEAVTSVNGKLGAVVLTAADVGALPASYQAPVAKVNGKTGNIVLSASDVGALPITYVPSWDETSGKPNLPALYQKKQRGIIGPPIPAVLARLSTDRTLPNLGYTYITWSNTLYDQFGIWNGTTGFVMPAWAKYVKVTGNVRFATNASGGRQAGIRKNGADVSGAAWDIGAAGGTSGGDIQCSRALISGVIPVVGGDLFQMMAFQSSGGPLNIEPGEVQQHTWVMLELYE